jgi:membrane dipeptidase
VTSIERVLQAMPIIDGHNDLPTQLRARTGYAVRGLSRVRPEFHTDIPRLRAGGVGAQFWSVHVPSNMPEPAATVATMEQIDAVYRLTAAYPDDLAMAYTADDIERVIAAGRIASLIGIEGGHSLATSLGVLRSCARLGGLNDEGRAIVREMQRIGVLADLSHVAPVTMHAALDAAEAPVIFSHSSVRALTDHHRNVPDDVLVRLRDNGGVVQVTFVPYFVSEEVRSWAAAAAAESERLGLSKAEGAWPRAPRPGEDPMAVVASLPPPSAPPEPLAAWLEANPRPSATGSQVADHVEHARDVAGIDHIGLGGDYDGTDIQPVGLDDVSGYPRLLAELADRGWSEPELEALTGRNVLRVLRETERLAEEPLWPR